MSGILDELAERVLIWDGAMGTELLRKGASLAQGLDSLNLTQPQWVREIHEAYVGAGADIIETNTFGGNRTRLEAVGMADSLIEINEAGVRLARSAAGDTAWVAGCVGPLGRGVVNPFEVFYEQAKVLCGAGVDLLVLETFADVDEMDAAIRACRAVRGDIAIAAHATVGASGEVPEELLARFEDWPVDIVGLNCSFGPGPMLLSIESILRRTTKPVSAIPSTGFGCTPEEFSAFAQQFIEAGVRLIGGCCGITPAHIAKISASSRDYRPS